MIEVSVTTNALKMGETLVRIGKNVSVFTPALKRSGEYMVSSIQQNFLSEGRPGKWQALSPMTIRLRKKGSGFGSALILRDSGALFRSITYALQNPETEVKIGTNLRYGKKLHFGGENVIPAHIETVSSYKRSVDGKLVTVKGFQRKVKQRSFKIPARPFVMFQDDDIPVLTDIFTGYIKEMIEKGKGGESK